MSESQERVRVELRRGEYFWGGVVRHGDRMPFHGGKPYSYDLYGNLDGNQGAPLLISSKGRYFYSEEPFSFEFRDGTLEFSRLRAELVKGQAEPTLRGAYLEACERFFPPSGRAPNPVCFTAPQYNAWIDMHRYPTQDKVMRYAHDILEAGMPPGILMIDDFWYRNPGVWEYEPNAFPEPKRMADELHALGFLLVLWTCPYVSPDTRRYIELQSKGYLLRDMAAKADDPRNSATVKWWNGQSAVLDLSNPEAAAWYRGELGRLVRELGVDGFKFDAGDPWLYMGLDDAGQQKRTPNGHCEDFARIGLDFSIAEYRACWKLGGQHLMQRVRDKGHRWEVGGLADTIPTSLAQGLMGYPFTCPDMIGGGLDIDAPTGGKGSLDQELFVRWAQSGALFPIVQFSLLPQRVLTGEYLSACMKTVELRKQLGSDIAELALQAARTGEPIMRHMLYEHPEDGFETVNDQFMLGDRYLVAPVLEKGARSRRVRFPRGRWLGDDGTFVEGPTELEVEAPLSRLPFYTRAT
jgi:alpha-glucosidase (family GH31 glycosyl hydrolase)